MMISKLSEAEFLRKKKEKILLRQKQADVDAEQAKFEEELLRNNNLIKPEYVTFVITFPFPVD